LLEWLTFTSFDCIKRFGIEIIFQFFQIKTFSRFKTDCIFLELLDTVILESIQILFSFTIEIIFKLDFELFELILDFIFEIKLEFFPIKRDLKSSEELSFCWFITIFLGAKLLKNQ
jgi:hypothetical protein